MLWPRHHMLGVAPDVWATMLEQIPQAAGLPLVRAWADRGWPLVVRRQGCGDLAGDLGVGLPLPPALGKLRLALTVPQGVAPILFPPPLLSRAAQAAPAGWQAAIAALVGIDPETRCFGSLAWQHLTGLDYLSPTSDLDLLWAAGDASTADTKAARIAEAALHAPMRIDGELVSGKGRGVQWREWFCGAGQVLVKSAQGTGLMARETVFA